MESERLLLAGEVAVERERRRVGALRELRHEALLRVVRREEHVSAHEHRRDVLQELLEEHRQQREEAEQEHRGLPRRARGVDAEADEERRFDREVEEEVVVAPHELLALVEACDLAVDAVEDVVEEDAREPGDGEPTAVQDEERARDAEHEHRERRHRRRDAAFDEELRDEDRNVVPDDDAGDVVVLPDGRLDPLPQLRDRHHFAGARRAASRKGAAKKRGDQRRRNGLARLRATETSSAFSCARR